MKAIQALTLAAGALLVAASLQAYAQDASAPEATAPAAATAASPTTAARQQARASRDKYRAVRAANRRLARKVRGALAREKGINVAKITVRAKDGAVTLQGSVPQQAQIDRAGDIAKGVDGVTSVTNSLTIRAIGSGSNN